MIWVQPDLNLTFEDLSYLEGVGQEHISFENRLKDPEKPFRPRLTFVDVMM